MKPGAPAGANGTAVATKALPSSSSFVNASVDGVCVCVCVCLCVIRGGEGE